MSKKISVAVACFLFIVSCVIFTPSATAIEEETMSFGSKIVYQDGFFDEIENDSEDSEESISVVFQFEPSVSCTHSTRNDEHRLALKAHYSNLNAKLVNQLGLDDYTDVTYSQYGPFVAYTYSSYDNWMTSDYWIMNSLNPQSLSCVYVENEIKPEINASRGEIYGDYTESQIKKDLGIPSNTSFDGTDIKIGVLELAIPENWSNIGNVAHDTYLPFNYDDKYVTDEDKVKLSNYKTHAYKVYSVIGGSTGLARDADLYFSAYHNESTLFSAVDWLIGNSVDVINHSCGTRNGLYSALTAYFDYVVRLAGVPVVAAAGNYHEPTNDWNINDESNGLNVFSVGAVNHDLRVSEFTSKELHSSCSSLLLKPTIAAPGGNVCGFGFSGLSGTSFSAPIVTGVIAMLMDEFPILIDNPERVMALLSNTCSWSMGQTSLIDDDCGFGIVNYSRARRSMSNLDDFVLTTTYTAQEDMVYETATVTLPPNSRLRVNGFVMNNSSQSTPVGTLVNQPDFTQIKVTLFNQTLYQYSQGTSCSNFTTCEVVNTSSTAHQYKIRVYTTENKTNTTYELCAIHYFIETIPEHSHRYTYEYEQISGNGVSHIVYCDCGVQKNENHDWNTPTIGQTMKCILCGYDSGVVLNGIIDEDVYYEK